MLSLIAGTRPNFMKIAPLHRALDLRGHEVRVIHTGQHYDATMSDVFFRDLGLPAANVHLSAGGGTHAEQTAAALVGLERELNQHRPDAAIVVGDVTSTLAGALAAAKLGVPVVHVESGLRSRDWTMPEEINRVVTDRISDLLLVPSSDGRANLIAEGIEPERIVFVGNVMIDSLHWAMRHQTNVLAAYGLSRGQYAVTTLHRPANVDSRDALVDTLRVVEAIGVRVPVVFPVHPRTRQKLEALGLRERLNAVPRLVITPPLGYFDFVTLTANAMLVATDSGGIQEETTALGIPCLTLRNGTERPITVTEGSNTIVGLDSSKVALAVDEIVAGRGKRGRVPDGWDGAAGERCADAIEAFLRGTPPPRTAGPRA